MVKALKKSLILLFSVLALSPIVFVQGAVTDMTGAFKTVGEVIVSVLKGIASFLSPVLDIFSSGSTEAIILGRVILGILIAICLYFGGVKNLKILKDQEGGTTAAKVITVIITIISAIGIPENIIKGIFGGWQLWLFVVAAIILLFSKGDSRLGSLFRGVSFLVLGLGAEVVRESLSDIAQIGISFIEAGLVIAGLYYLLIRIWKGTGEDIGGAIGGVGGTAAGLLSRTGEGAVKGVEKLRDWNKRLAKSKGPKLKETKKQTEDVERIEILDAKTIDNIIASLENIRNVISQKGITESSYSAITSFYSTLLRGIEEHKKNLQAAYSLHQTLASFGTVTLPTKEDKIKLEDGIKLLNGLINNLSGSERRAEQKLAEVISNFKSIPKDVAVSKLNEIIEIYKTQKNAISNMIGIIEEIRTLLSNLSQKVDAAEAETPDQPKAILDTKGIDQIETQILQMGGAAETLRKLIVDVRKEIVTYQGGKFTVSEFKNYVYPNITHFQGELEHLESNIKYVYTLLKSMRLTSDSERFYQDKITALRNQIRVFLDVMSGYLKDEGDKEKINDLIKLTLAIEGELRSIADSSHTFAQQVKGTNVTNLQAKRE